VELEHQSSTIKLSETQFQGLLESAPDAMIVVHKDGIIFLVNAQTERLFGYTREELFGKSVEMLLPERFKERYFEFRTHYLAEPKLREMSGDLDLYGLRKDGKEFSLELSLSPLETKDGLLVISAIRDVSVRREEQKLLESSLREKEVLLKEIHHRVKNNLQIITSLLRLQYRKTEDKEARKLFLDSESRVHTIALLHEKLYRSEDISNVNLKDFLNSILNYLFHAYGNSEELVSYHINVESCVIESERLISVGLIVNELVSNSLKYAFPNDRKGNISVTLEKRSQEKLSLSISDNGVGLPAGFDFEKATTLGLLLVKNLTKQLGGTFEISQNKETEFKILFPLNQ